jgi:hypothetical protein
MLINQMVPGSRGRMTLVIAWAGMMLVVAGGLRAAGDSQDAPSLPTLLERAADYVSGYEAQFSGLVAEEHYTQVVRILARTMSRRVLRSDVLLIREEGNGWFGFRDVFEVDGAQVRDRGERLYRLFIKPAPGALDRANAIMAESTRFNVGSIKRNINLPTMALAFLRKENLDRSQFTLGGSEIVAGERTRIVEFVETLTPRIISTPDGAPARGRAWLDVASGRVVQTELAIDSVVSLTKVLVTYAPQPRAIGVIVPVRMEEEYRVGPQEAITGVAEYSNFRAFTVETKIGKIGR